MKLQLLQNAGRSIDDLRIVETLDEFQSITSGYGKCSNLKYQTYYDLLINACVRYDGTEKANIGKGGHIYQAATYNGNDGFAGETPFQVPWGDPSQGMDTPSDEFYHINTTHASPPISSRHMMQPINSGPNQFPK